MTNLPSSETAYETGIEERTVSLAEAMTPGAGPIISSFAGLLLSATLFGHNFQHLHRFGPNENPGDFAGGEYWKRHRKMDNVLSNTFMFLPDNLRIPSIVLDLNVVFMHMNIHASVICLHQAAIVMAQRYGLEANVVRQSRSRSLMAAQEITNLMRSCSHIDGSRVSYSLFRPAQD